MQRESLLRRLMFIKYLVRLARDEAAKPEPYCASSILIMHDAVELILQLGCEHLNVGEKKMDFMRHFDVLDPVCTSRLERRESMRRLNDARVGLKHHGTTPARREILAFSVAVDEFCVENFPRIFGVLISEVSLADLVVAESVRSCLKTAEQALANTDLSVAASATGEAYARLVSEYGIRTDSGSVRRALQGLSAELNIKRHNNAFPKVAEAIENLFEEVALLRQGIDSRHLAIFRALTPRILVMMANNAVNAGGGKENVTIGDMQFCYDFVLDTALQVQQPHTIAADLVQHRIYRSSFGAL